MNKYHNKKVVVNGLKFDSKREAARYRDLQLLERAGQIKDLRRQVRYMLAPSVYDDDGKCIERCATYVADFVYHDKAGNLVVEDCKGLRTDAYILKRKWMLKEYGIRILET